MDDSQSIAKYLAVSAERHSHLCPRQVLGVRIALAGASFLGLEIPRSDKRLLVILETDGCFADGIEAASGAAVGHRTMRIEDYGKIAATFVDIMTGKAVRAAPQPGIRLRARSYAPNEEERYFAQLAAYQVMPVSELLSLQAVTLSRPVSEIISRPNARVTCCQCGEEIINDRQIYQNSQPLCRSCVGEGYYH